MVMFEGESRHLPVSGNMMVVVTQDYQHNGKPISHLIYLSYQVATFHRQLNQFLGVLLVKLLNFPWSRLIFRDTR